MTDTPAEVEAARALVAAYDALNSPEHAAESEKLRELSLKVTARADAFAAAQAALHAANAGACAAGVPPAANAQARAVLFPNEHLENAWETGGREPGHTEEDRQFYGGQKWPDDIVDLTDMPHSYPDEPDEFSTPRANGALTEN